MSVRSWPVADPNANLKYWFDWRPWISVEEGGTIVDFSISIEEGDGALVLGDVAMGTGAYSGVIMLWLSGGVADMTYRIRCRITLTDGTIEDRSRLLSIVEK